MYGLMERTNLSDVFQLEQFQDMHQMDENVSFPFSTKHEQTPLKYQVQSTKEDEIAVLQEAVSKKHKKAATFASIQFE